MRRSGDAPPGGAEPETLEPDDPEVALPPGPSQVVKGGSYLSAANYSLRYRPAARRAQPPNVPTAHIGFRCVVRDTSA